MGIRLSVPEELTRFTSRHVDCRYPPVMISGMGGSGTRLVSHIVHGLGVRLGIKWKEDLGNRDNLTIPHRRLCRFNLRNAIYPPRWPPEMPPWGITQCLIEGIEQVIQQDHHWGWKEPSAIFSLPQIAVLFPDVRFIYVVRNPLDISQSMRCFYATDENEASMVPLIGDFPKECELETDTESIQARMCFVWNLYCLWFQFFVGRIRCLRIRYEDIVMNSSVITDQIAEFLGIKSILISMPDLDDSKIGRYRWEHESQLQEIAGMTLMKEFGYV